MIFCIDIDGTICRTKDGDYANSVPLKSRIKKLNNLYKEHKIIYHTARGAVTGINWGPFTKKQLESWGVMYHELIMGKIYADRYIDDKSTNANDFFSTK